MRMVRRFPPLLLAGAVALALPAVASAQDAPVAAPGAATEVPPLPEKAEPGELVAFAKQVLSQPMPQGPRDTMMKLFQKRAALALEAAERALPAVKPADAVFEDAARMKMQALMMLAQLGDRTAPPRLGEFAATLVDSPSKTLAREARRMTILTDMQGLFTAGDATKAGPIVDRIVALVEEDPTDGDTANLAMQTATVLERFPGGSDVSRSIYRRLAPVLEASDDERTKALGAMFAGTLRRLDLPGNEMEISGTNMDGTPFDQKQLAGKVVLVDFWATWCGPCIAEIPNVREQYEKYHDKGFEVVGISLDEDRGALESFITDQKIPWIILHEQSVAERGGHPLAAKYGITGIPTVILVGRDGKVVSMDVRGEKLGVQLDKLFKDAK